jgi:hypothetical protein
MERRGRTQLLEIKEEEPEPPREHPFDEPRFQNYSYSHHVTIYLPANRQPVKIGWAWNRVRKSRSATVDETNEHITVYFKETFVPVLPHERLGETFFMTGDLSQIKYLHAPPPLKSALRERIPTTLEELLEKPRDFIIAALNELQLSFGQPGQPTPSVRTSPQRVRRGPIIGCRGPPDPSLVRLNKIFYPAPIVRKKLGEPVARKRKK